MRRSTQTETGKAPVKAVHVMDLVFVRRRHGSRSQGRRSVHAYTPIYLIRTLDKCCKHLIKSRVEKDHGVSGAAFSEAYTLAYVALIRFDLRKVINTAA